MRRPSVQHRSNRTRAGAIARVLALAITAAGMVIGCTTNAPPRIPPKYPDLAERKVPPYFENTIEQRCASFNTQPLLINNYGLVVNLYGTGDCTAPSAVRAYMTRQMEKYGFGSKVMPGFENLDPERVMHDKRVAIVRVDGLIPPGARARQPFDLHVAALEGNATTSLSHGKLYFTDLFRSGADPRVPGSQIDVLGTGEGYLFVNPVYALTDDSTDPKVRASLRFALVPSGGVVQKDRPIALQLRHAQLSMSRAIEYHINDFFQRTDVARAYDEGIVQIFVPESFHGDWQHFLGLVNHLYVKTGPGFGIVKAKQLAEAAEKPDAPLDEISFAWEGLGKDALPIIAPLMVNPRTEVSYAAARAAAFIGDPNAVDVLGEIAQASGNPFQVQAVQTMGALPHSPKIDELLRGLVDSDQMTVRIAAYRVLAAHEDSSIYSEGIQQKFVLDVVPSNGPPLIWASRTGVPRIAIFGNKPALRLPMMFAALGNRLTISADTGDKDVRMFFRGPGMPAPVDTLSAPDIAEVIARLGGEGPPGEQKFGFSYGDVVAIVQALADQKLIYSSPPATPAGGTAGMTLAMADMPAPMVLQAATSIQQEIADAPVIEDRPQGEQIPDIGDVPAPSQGSGSKGQKSGPPDLSPVRTGDAQENGRPSGS